LRALVIRLGEVFKMEEFKKERLDNVPYDQVGIILESSSFSWGFRVKED